MDAQTARPEPYPADVITGFFAAVGRHRRVILVVGLVLAAGVPFDPLRVPSPDRRPFPVMAAATAVLLLGIVAVAWDRPKAFVVEPRRARVQRSTPTVLHLHGIGVSLIVTGRVGNIIRDREKNRSCPTNCSSWAGPSSRSCGSSSRGGNQGAAAARRVWQRGITGWLVIPLGRITHSPDAAAIADGPQRAIEVRTARAGASTRPPRLPQPAAHGRHRPTIPLCRHPLLHRPP